MLFVDMITMQINYLYNSGTMIIEKQRLSKIILILLIVFTLAVLPAVCSNTSPPQDELTENTGIPAPTYPTEKPDITIPADFTLSDFAGTYTGEKVALTENTENWLFTGCEVQVSTDNIEIRECCFENTRVILSDVNDVTFNRSIFQNLYQYEQVALGVYDCRNTKVDRCQFNDNYIGLGIHGSSVEVKGCRFMRNNGHNALVIGEGSVARVEGSYFYGSFRHAALVMNREGHPDASVIISNNYIDQTGEDALDFEDYRSASPSIVSNNIITNTGWAAVLVEYNSWSANIAIEGNWIENTGIDWELPIHPLQPEPFQRGGGQGILVEDSSGVSVFNNMMTGAGGSGIEVRNSRNIRLQGNGINCKEVGIGVYCYYEGALHRAFSPLSREDAGCSEVVTSNNTIINAKEPYDVDEGSKLTGEGE